jgi:uncharacterized protein (TIGR02996 family)
MDGAEVTPAEAALTAAVVSTPDDDLPRLVFADWCDENGEPERAEFIRLQCALARPDGLTADRLIELRIREKVMLSAHGERWLEPLRRKGEPLFSQKSHGQFHRGFVEVVWMPAAEFTKTADRLFRRCPVRELRVTQTTVEEFQRLMWGDAVTRLEALDLSERGLGNVAPFSLAANAHRWPAGKLTRVRLRACEIDDLGANALTGIHREVFAPDELDVSLNPIGEPAMRLLRLRYADALQFS